MRTALAILAVTGIAIAAETSAAATPSANPSYSIPSGIAQSCSDFLSAFNTAPAVQSCLSPFLTALKGSSNASISTVCSASTSSACSPSVFHAYSAYFAGNCSKEVSAPASYPVVAKWYDILYAFIPFTQAVCSKDESGKYCLIQLAANSSASDSSHNAQTPLTSGDGSPDAQAFTNANIFWLGINAKKPLSCTTCLKKILTSYISWESSTPPANGIANSKFLSSQADLWASVQKTCPADFISGTLANAGASPGAANGASTSSPAKSVALMLAVVAAGLMAL